MARRVRRPARFDEETRVWPQRVFANFPPPPQPSLIVIYRAFALSKTVIGCVLSVLGLVTVPRVPRHFRGL